MKKVLKITLLSGLMLVCFCIVFSSCKKPNSSFDTYFYLSKSISGETSATLNIDGKSYGNIQYVAAPVTAQSTGTVYVKLPSGQHNIIIYDQSNKAIISGYISLASDGMGSGSWGPAGGGMDCESNGNNSSTVTVGLFE